MNVKPGDLAVIIRTKKCPELIGRIVQVICIAPAGRFKHSEAGWIDLDVVSWEVRFVGRIGMLPTKSGKSRESWVAFAHDYQLRPISGVPVEDEQHDEVKA